MQFPKNYQSVDSTVSTTNNYYSYSSVPMAWWDNVVTTVSNGATTTLPGNQSTNGTWKNIYYTSSEMTLSKVNGTSSFYTTRTTSVPNALACTIASNYAVRPDLNVSADIVNLSWDTDWYTSNGITDYTVSWHNNVDYTVVESTSTPFPTATIVSGDGENPEDFDVGDLTDVEPVVSFKGNNYSATISYRASTIQSHEQTYSDPSDNWYSLKESYFSYHSTETIKIKSEWLKTEPGTKYVSDNFSSTIDSKTSMLLADKSSGWSTYYTTVDTDLYVLTDNNTVSRLYSSTLWKSVSSYATHTWDSMTSKDILSYSIITSSNEVHIDYINSNSVGFMITFSGTGEGRVDYGKTSVTYDTDPYAGEDDWGTVYKSDAVSITGPMYISASSTNLGSYFDSGADPQYDYAWILENNLTTQTLGIISSTSFSNFHYYSYTQKVELYTFRKDKPWGPFELTQSRNTVFKGISSTFTTTFAGLWEATKLYATSFISSTETESKVTRQIKPGEELTITYTTTMGDDDE